MEKLEIVASNRGYQVTEEGDVIGIRGNKLSSKPVGIRGYHYFSFRYKGLRKVILTHRLQAYQKYGNKAFNKGIEVRHLDGNPLNNSWDNIAIGNHSDNMMDIPEQIRIKKAKHASSFLRKYDKEKVKEYHSKTKSYKKTMNKFNISSKGTLNYILNN